MRRSILLIGFISLILATTPGCYPGGPEALDELGLVVSFYGPELDYSGLRTYAMMDEVIELDSGSGGSDPIDPIYHSTILEAIQDNMATRGFIRVDESVEDPDLWLDVGAVQSDVWVQWYSWGYWGGYYPPYTGVAKFEQGSIIWQLLDLRDIDDPTTPDGEPTVMWIAGINGAVKNSQSANHSAITAGVGQGFDQSPYIVAENSTKMSGQEDAR